METPMPELKVLRFVGGVLIDQPFSDPVWPIWAGTLEPDRTAPGGWRRTVWASGPAGRGWEVATLHVGDVVEFGSHADPSRRWFGWHAHYSADNGAIVVCGPYATPDQAWSEGRDACAELDDHVLDEYREARLANALADVPDPVPAAER